MTPGIVDTIKVTTHVSEIFESYPKIPRYSRECIITEKIDGTNAQVVITRADPLATKPGFVFRVVEARSSDDISCYWIAAGSRTRWITPGSDNHGFAAWVTENAEALVAALGPGRHFGEWWGNGIQRGYGLPRDDKRFSLFNVTRWDAVAFQRYKVTPATLIARGMAKHGKVHPIPVFKPLPPFLSVVPTLWIGMFGGEVPDYPFPECSAIALLEREGSMAAPGFRNPEGIVIYHVQSGILFKKTLKDDVAGKEQV